MSFDFTAVLIRPLRPIADRELRHRAVMTLAAVAAVLLALTLAVYGFDYYRLDLAGRPISEKHPELRPGGTIGLRLGILGLFLFLLIYLYPLRKRWMWLGSKGKTTHWLNYHVLLGLVAPVIITFHASFKTQGLAGLAYWTMLALTFSGIVGRYFYAQIPRSMESTQAALAKLEHQAGLCLERLASSNVDSLEITRILRLPSAAEVEKMSAGHALYRMMLLDAVRLFCVWRARRRCGHMRFRILGGLLSTGLADLETAISTVRKQALLSKKTIFLSKTQRVFYLWHVIHRPFSLSFAVLVLMHLTVVLLLGYF
jgi:hypothetical protein